MDTLLRYTGHIGKWDKCKNLKNWEEEFNLDVDVVHGREL